MSVIATDRPEEAKQETVLPLRQSKDRSDELDLLLLIQRIPSAWAAGQSLSGGPLAIGSHMHAHGHNVKILDNNSVFRDYSDVGLLDVIAEQDPKVVGLSVNMLNAFTSYELVKKIKARFPDKYVISGGLHTFDEPYEVAEEGFHLTFIGEAEVSLIQFMDLIAENPSNAHSSALHQKEFFNKLSAIPGLLINVDGELTHTGKYEIIDDLDDLALLNYDLLNLEDFIRIPTDHLRVTNLLNFQRGCPFKCTFCKADFMGGKVRENSADYMVNALRVLHEKYGQTHFVLTDSNFTMKRKRVLEFCEKMIESGLSEIISFWIQTSIIVTMRDEDLRLLKQAGLARISFGVERFSPEFREGINKAGTQDEVFDILKKIKDQGLKNEINILINFPEDTVESLELEAEHIKKALPFVDYVLVNYLVPIPGTAVYESDRVKRKWYLDEEINYKKSSYYDQVFQINSPGVEFNLFGHSPEVLRASRKFKERLYVDFQSRLYKFPFVGGALLFQLLMRTDVLLGRISYFLYFHISPTVEGIVFWPIKTFREAGVKYFLAKWYHRTENNKEVPLKSIGQR